MVQCCWVLEFLSTTADPTCKAHGTTKSSSEWQRANRAFTCTHQSVGLNPESFYSSWGPRSGRHHRSWAITPDVQFLIFKATFWFNFVSFQNISSRLVTLCKSCHKKEKNDNDCPKCWYLNSSLVYTMYLVFTSLGFRLNTEYWMLDIMERFWYRARLAKGGTADLLKAANCKGKSWFWSRGTKIPQQLVGKQVEGTAQKVRRDKTLER